MGLPKTYATAHPNMASPGEQTQQSFVSTQDNIGSSAYTVETFHITSPSVSMHLNTCATLSNTFQIMNSPKSSATAHFIMASPGENSKQSPTTTDNNMLSLSTITTGSGPSQRPPPTFNGLPTELKKLIVHHAEDSCLANLRLTNKELDAIATKPFGERLLAERRFMLSRYSLQGLVDLTAHPDFGK